MGNPALQVWYLVRYVGRQFIANGGLNSAAALTYTTLFAVVPVMTVGYSTLSILPVFDGVAQQIQAFIFGNFLPSSGEILQQTLASFSEQARKLTIAGMALLLVTVYFMLVNVESAFNNIWRVREQRKGVSRFLLYWAVLSMGPPLIATGFLVSSYLFSLPLLTEADTYGFREWFLSMLPWITSAVAFTLLYSVVPNCRVPFRFAVIGGLATMLLFEGLKKGFALFVAKSDMTLIYGTFAAVPLFLIWVFLCWSMVLLGAEMTRALAVRPRRGATIMDNPLYTAIRVLRMLVDGHRQGRAITEEEMTRTIPELSADEWRLLMDSLLDHAMVARLADGSWTLLKSARGVVVWDLFLALPQSLRPEHLVAEEWSEALPVLEALQDMAETGRSSLTITLESLCEGPEPVLPEEPREALA
jgi:membrane protein